MPILLKSRRFWLLVLDTIVSISTYFVGKYAGLAAQDTLFLITALQPVFVALIISITIDDAVNAWVRVRTRLLDQPIPGWPIK